MRNLDRRLRALEAESRSVGWGPFLDTLDDTDLSRLETILNTLPPFDRQSEVVAALTALNDEDAAFLESIVKGREAMQCAA